MIKEFIETYADLADSTTYNIIVKPSDDNLHYEIVVNILGRNYQTNQWEYVEITFEQVIEFTFKIDKRNSPLGIWEVYIQDGDTVLFDFIPIYDNSAEIVENPDSPFKIRCVNIKYKVTGLRDLN